MGLRNQEKFRNAVANRRLQRTRSRGGAAVVPQRIRRVVDPKTKQAVTLVLCFLWLSRMLYKTPGWKDRLALVVKQKLEGWIDAASVSVVTTTAATATATTETTTVGTTQAATTQATKTAPQQQPIGTTERDTTKDINYRIHYHKHRIPCGLLSIEGETKEEAKVYPLATLGIAAAAALDDSDEKQPETGVRRQAKSTLHARALKKYPELEKHVTEEHRSASTAKATTMVVPEGAFRLRMGSEESTIERSPKLEIVYHSSSSGKNDGDSSNEQREDQLEDDHEDHPEDIDLVLGSGFWKDHSAEFGDHEVYLFPTKQQQQQQQQEQQHTGDSMRVMVPYLLVRSMPSFGAESSSASEL